MLDLENLDYKDLLNMYEDLQTELCTEIIKRIQRIGNISSYTKAQIKVLAKINGKEIFYNTIDKISGLTQKQKQELKKIYEQAMKDDLKSYKAAFEYRGKEMKLTASQLRILNKSLIEENAVFKRLTQNIAFASQRQYVEGLTKAYMQTVTGGIDYTRAIYNTSKEIAESGIQLEDSLGRKTQIDVAVRRNVLDSIHQTANEINRDIEEQLGCNGYEVSAHAGARPSHAEAQGLQYALTRRDASKYGVGYWGDVEELWSEPNCRHSYFGIILGVSEPVYTKSEVNRMKNAKVTYKGKRIPLYEAYQRQRYYERNIRAKKRALECLKKTNQDTKDVRFQLNNYYRKYRELNNETGLDRRTDLTRI